MSELIGYEIAKRTLGIKRELYKLEKEEIYCTMGKDDDVFKENRDREVSSKS